MQRMMEAIAALTAQVIAITTWLQNLDIATGNKETATITASTFAMTPGQWKVEYIIDYNDKVSVSLWNAPIDALLIKFDVKALGMATFVEGTEVKAQEFGWLEDSKQIATFKNDADVNTDIIEQYGHINAEKLKIDCERFITGVDKETRAHQNNEMMHKCIIAILTADAKLQLIPHWHDTPSISKSMHHFCTRR